MSIVQRTPMPGPADLEISSVQMADIDGIHQLEERCFPSPWRREFFESELRNDGRLNLIARRQGRLVGYLFAMWFFDEMHVNKIAVAERDRRQGIADALMDRCLETARRNRIHTVSLEVRKSNRGAQEFYKHLDFSPTYVRPRYYPDGEAAVVMVRELGG